jgi:cation:H+ antiporter
LSSLALWQWAGFFLLAAVVLVRAGIVLAGAADEIATRTGLGGLFVGTVFTAVATSLPEIVTVVSAVIAGAPELAVGAVFGSSMANMAVLGIIDLARRQRLLGVSGSATRASLRSRSR